MKGKKKSFIDLTIYEKQYFGYFILKWLKSAKIRLKSSTYSNYQYVLDARIIPTFAHIKIKEMNADLVVRYTSKLLEEGLCPKTVKDILIVLQSILNFADIKIKITMPKVPKHEIQILKKEEQKKLEKTLLKDLNITNFGIYFCLYTGLRIGELCALKWENIDMKEKKVMIKKTIIRVKNPNLGPKKTTVIIDEPKSTSSIREIPIPSFLISLLKTFQGDPNYFFLTGTEKMIETRTFFNRYKKELKKIQLDSYNFHALRHTFATRCIENGCDPKTLSEILGHANVKTTLDRYVHPNFDIKMKMMNRLVPMYEIGE